MYNRQFIWTITKRFLRTFIAGGAAQAVLILQTQGIECFQDMRNLFVILLVAFFTGGFSAIDKAYRYEK